MKLRIQFHKLGPARFTSHKDTIRMFQRCFSACGIPVSYSEGFHPHMRLSFAPPLKTGWEGHEEYLDVEVDGPPGELRNTCSAHLPEGVGINHVYILSERAPKIAADIRAASISVRVHAEDQGGEGAGETERALREHFVTGKPVGGDNAEPRVLELSAAAAEDGIEIRYTTTSLSGKIVGPAALVGPALGDPADFAVPLRVARRAQFVERAGELVSPIDKGVLLNRS
jgi:radical SAM-linked protein